MNRSIRLGRVLGITINLHYSWFLIFGLITFLHYFSYPPEYHPLLRLLAGMIASVFLFASVVAHELSHSFVAIRNGIPVKSITLFFLGGVAHITQEAEKPVTEFKMAIAGPLCSLILAFFFGLIWFLIWGRNQAFFEAANFNNPVLWLALINFSLGLFNLAPGFPLDGGRILRSLVWWKTGNYKQATRVASFTGKGFAYLLIGGGGMILFSGFFYEDSAPFLGIQFIIIGWFLQAAVSANSRQMEMHDALQGLTAKAVMSPGWVAIPPNLSLTELAQAYLLTTSQRYFVVTEEGRMTGVITVEDMKRVPHSLWYTTSVREAMTPADKLVIAHPQEGALSILQKMNERGMNYMPVMTNGMFTGMIFRQNLIRFIRLRTEFKV